MKALFVTFVLVLVTISCTQEPSAAAGWPFIGSDQAHTKYSAAEEITASNVGELEIAWNAIDAATGELDSDFGESGSVALTEGHGREVSRFEFDQTSPPVVFEDLVIVGSCIPDGVQREFDPPGTVQAFDKATGAELWRGATPYPTNGNPMTYRTESGRQFVVIATGRGADAALVAFAHPGQ